MRRRPSALRWARRRLRILMLKRLLFWARVGLTATAWWLWPNHRR